jgi:GT2 family glycosyltransferase
MVRRDAFDAVNGFDETFAVEFNDIDFCLRLRRAGYRNVCLPHVELVHDESKTRGAADTPAKRSARFAERARFQERWHSATFRDPYYNEWLTRVDESGGLPE